MSMAAKHGDVFAGIALGNFTNHLARINIGKMREMSSVRVSAFIPSSGFKRWNMGCDPDVILLRQRLGKDVTEVFR